MATWIQEQRRYISPSDARRVRALVDSAVRVLTRDPVETVALLLSHRAISPNGIHPPGSGTTPLHLAASLGRADIVNLLLEQENIDDTIVDSQGRNCKDVARGKAVVRAIEGV